MRSQTSLGRGHPGLARVEGDGVAQRPGDGEHAREFPTLTADNIGGVGEAAVRSVIDILTGRQEPPRR